MTLSRSSTCNELSSRENDSSVTSAETTRPHWVLLEEDDSVWVSEHWRAESWWSSWSFWGSCDAILEWVSFEHVIQPGQSSCWLWSVVLAWECAFWRYFSITYLQLLRFITGSHVFSESEYSLYLTK